MKKAFLLLATTSIALMLISCEDSNLQLGADATETKTDEFGVSLDKALNVANAFWGDNNNSADTRAQGTVVKNVFTIKDEDGASLLHAINYDNGGFVLVAGDNRLNPVQAYSTKGKFLDNQNEYPLGVKIWMQSLKDSLRIMKLENISPDEKTCAAWLKFTKGTMPKIQTRSQTPEGGMRPEADTLVGPFLTDSWHQESPYNDNLESCNHYNYLEAYLGSYTPVVGCIPLAISRIMRYHEFPASFSWNNMPDNTPQTTTTKNFIKDVFDNVKSYANANNYRFRCYLDEYDGKSTVVDRLFPIGLFMRSEYGFASGSDNSYSVSSYTAMKRDMIDHSLPCIISGRTSSDLDSGFGHAWICDGYHYHFEHWYDQNNNPIGVENTYIHYLWGDTTTNYDGWYSSNNVTYVNTSYQYHMRLTNHISPVDYWDVLLDPIN